MTGRPRRDETLLAAPAPQPSPTDQINAMSAEATGVLASFRAALLQAQQQIAADQREIAALKKPKPGSKPTH